MTQLVYENDYCKVTWASGKYILTSKSDKYPVHYYRDIIEVSRATMIPVREIYDYSDNHK